MAGTRRAARLDVAIVVVLSAWGQLEAWGAPGADTAIAGPPVLNAVAFLIASAALLWRRRAPVTVLLVEAANLAVLSVLAGGSEALGWFLPLLVSIYSAARYAASPLRAVPALALVAAALLLHDLRDREVDQASDVVVFWLILVAAWPVGAAIRRWSDRTEQARLLAPDVVLMDVRMPRLDGLEATRRILAERSPPRVIVLTTFDLDEYVFAAMKAGASGFLLKDLRRDQLIGAIRTAAAGDALLAPAVTRRLIERFCSEPPPTDALPESMADLTARSSKCSSWSRAASQIARSVSRCSSAMRPSRRTSHTCTPSSACAIASRPSCWRTRRGSCAPASRSGRRDGPAPGGEAVRAA